MLHYFCQENKNFIRKTISCFASPYCLALLPCPPFASKLESVKVSEIHRLFTTLTHSNLECATLCSEFINNLVMVRLWAVLHSNMH